MSESMRARWQALAQHPQGHMPDPQHYPPHSPYTSLAGGWVSALVQMSSSVTMTREGTGSAGTSSKGASPPSTFTCPCDSQPPRPCRLLNPHSRTSHSWAQDLHWHSSLTSNSNAALYNPAWPSCFFLPLPPFPLPPPPSPHSTLPVTN